jgi:hypothetical protein
MGVEENAAAEAVAAQLGGRRARIGARDAPLDSRAADGLGAGRLGAGRLGAGGFGADGFSADGFVAGAVATLVEWSGRGGVEALADAAGTEGGALGHLLRAAAKAGCAQEPRSCVADRGAEYAPFRFWCIRK